MTVKRETSTFARPDVEGVTAVGWSRYGLTSPWTQSEFILLGTLFGIRPVDPPAPVRWEPLSVVVGIDELEGGTDEAPVIEFAMANGNVIGASVSSEFVSALIEALRHSAPVTAVASPTSEPVVEEAPEPVAVDPAFASEPPAPEVAERPIADPPPPPPSSGRAASKKALADEITQLRSYLEGFGFAERSALHRDITSLSVRRAEVLAELREAVADQREAESALVRVREEEILQEVGVYATRHRLENAVSARDQLDELRSRINAMVVDGDEAVTATDDWTVNGSRSEGRKVVVELSKLMLRAYNGEAEVLVATMAPYKLDSAIDRLTKSRETIARLGKSMSVEVTERFHRLRIDELTLTADYLAKQADERSAVRQDGDGLDHLYVASNVGAFGDDVVRIGVTARREPGDVVADLDTGAVPFPFEVHALVFNADALALAANVRDRLVDQRVNLADARCEFFHATPDAVLEILGSLGSEPIMFARNADAPQFRQSENARSELAQ